MPYAPRRRAPRPRLLASAPRGRRIGPRRRTSRTRRAAIGAFASVALVCAGYLGWEFIGTNVVARQHQHRAISALLGAWDRKAPSVTADGVAVDAIIRIPRFGPGYSVPVVEGTSSRSLGMGVGHVIGSARPGAPGNVVLAGHRVTHGEPFRSLPSLRSGDEVIIETLTTGYVYRVASGASASRRVPDTSSWVLASSPQDPTRVHISRPGARRLITLITCAELFHTSDRLVVFGELVRTYPRVLPHPEA